MIKVLLVDDNRFSLEYFSNLIDWESYGFTLAGTALDGEFALSQFKTLSPQVVITDIQMPNMNGIELARQIIQIAPETVILFLSSYEEFQYAKAALQMGIYDYLLKHEVTKEILAQKLKEITTRVQDNEQTKHYVDEGNLLHLINASGSPEFDQSRHIFSQYPGQYGLLLFLEDHVLPEFRALSGSSDTEAPENRVKDYLYQNPKILSAVHVADFTYAVLIKSAFPLYETADALISRFYATFHRTASAALIAECQPIQRCFADYLTVRQHSGRKYFYPPASVLSRDVFLSASSEKLSVQTKDLSDLARKQDFKAINIKLKKDLNTAILLKDNDAFSKLTQETVSILTSLHRNLLTADQQSLFELSDMDEKTYWYDATSAFHWLIKQFDILEQIQEERTTSQYSATVNAILLYIHQNYQDPELTVEQIASHFDINMNQLNYLVKKEIGESVIKRITRVRMERARVLLDEKHLRISEVSQRIGYSSVSYFSNVFKKYYGISPQEYQKKGTDRY